MEIIKGLDFKIKNSAVSLGKFDGFHRGHRLLLDRILEHPELHATVFTFDGILKGKQIYLEEEKRSLLERLGVEREVLFPFSEETRSMTPETFIREMLVEPDNRYGDALWYCYAVISTAGFGDVVAVTFIGKMCSVLLTIYSLFVVAIATGVVVNFYTQMVELQRKETLAMFMDQLERLPELSREELENISRKVRQFR